MGESESKKDKLGNLSALKDFISFLSTVSGDLSNITAPPFILAPQSLTEFPTYWAEHPSLFSAPAFEPSAERRMLYVLENYLASLQRQYYIGQPVSAGTKKPLNPFLGELFFGQSQDPNGKGKVKVICEQVSHHPPTTAAFLEDEENGVRAEAYSTQYTTLSGTSVVVRQSGHALLTVDKHNETYLLPFPDIYAKSVLTGSPYPELSGTYRLASTSGLVADITFGGKSHNPFSSSGRNNFEASIYKSGESSRGRIYEISGVWSDKWTVKDGSGKKLYEYDLSDEKNKPVDMMMASLDKQNPWESRRAWQGVIKGLQEGDFQAALQAKSKLESAQREMRKREKAEGKKWEQAFFVQVSEEEKRQSHDRALDHLIESLGRNIDVKNILSTEGCWSFDREKEKKWREGLRQRPESPTG